MERMSDYDTAIFFADWGKLDQDKYLRLVYDLQSTIDPRQAAAFLCAEQSTAMWRRPGVDEDLRERWGAKVVEMKPIDNASKWRVVIAHPHENFGTRIPNLLVAAAGEGAFYSPGIATIKLQDILFPTEYLKAFAGPQFGLAGLRDRLGIFDRPFFIGVVKPNLGLSPEDFASLAYESWCGGLDIAKDDEMLADAPWSTLQERVQRTAARMRQAERSTGERKGFIANITDEVDQLTTQYHIAEAAGANIVLINPIWTGISALRSLRKVSQLPLMGHFAGAAILSRNPDFGVSSALLTKLLRIAGADMIGIAGFGERMATPAAEVLDNIRACLEPLGNIAPALPIPGGSDSAQTLPGVVQQIGHADFGFICGRGVFAHPSGPKAGAASLRNAWNGIRDGRSISGCL